MTIDGVVFESERLAKTLADFCKSIRGRLLRALVDQIVVDEAAGKIVVQFRARAAGAGVNAEANERCLDRRDCLTCES